jgi:hypothetical protein
MGIFQYGECGTLEQGSGTVPRSLPLFVALGHCIQQRQWEDARSCVAVIHAHREVRGDSRLAANGLGEWHLAVTRWRACASPSTRTPKDVAVTTPSETEPVTNFDEH